MYKKGKTNNDFLGKKFIVFGQTFLITIENEYYGTLQNDEIEKTFGTELVKVTYTMYHSLSQSKQYVWCTMYWRSSWLICYFIVFI